MANGGVEFAFYNSTARAQLVNILYTTDNTNVKDFFPHTDSSILYLSFLKILGYSVEQAYLVFY